MNTQLTVQNIIDIPPRMILELASGIKQPEEIAADFGYSADQWLRMSQFEPLKKAVEDKKSELKSNGWAFRAKCAWMAEELLVDLYDKAKDAGVSLSGLLETVKFTAKAAGVDAPIKEEAQTGNTFSININIGGAQKTVHVGIKQNQENVIEHEAPNDKEKLSSWLNDLGEAPAHLKNSGELQIDIGGEDGRL